HKEGSSSFQRAGKGLRRYYDVRNLWLLLRKHPQHRPGRRTRARAGLEYLEYVYHRYTLEREHGHHETADAVLAGLSDAGTGRGGLFVPGRRAAVPALRWLFDSYRRWRSRSSCKDAAHENASAQ